MHGRAGVGFVELDVIVAEDALVFFELIVGEFLEEEFAILVFGVVAFDFGEDGGWR